MTTLTKRRKKVIEGINREQAYNLPEAVTMLKSRATAKFDETVEVVIMLALDTTKADQTLRGTVLLPNGTGKTRKVLVIAKGAKAKEAQDAGADFVGAEELADKINGGFTGFDVCIATPDMMGIVGKLGKVLGPRGLMPTPKLGTVTMDVAAAVKAAKGGQIEFRAEKAGIVHAGVGKASFTAEALVQNIRALMDAIIKAKPAGAKGNYIKKVAISSTMGPGLKLDLTTLAA